MNPNNPPTEHEEQGAEYPPIFCEGFDTLALAPGDTLDSEYDFCSGVDTYAVYIPKAERHEE